jgi:hypothetical protein
MAREGAPTPEEAQSDFKDLEELSLGDQRKFMVENALRAHAYEPPAVWSTGRRNRRKAPGAAYLERVQRGAAQRSRICLGGE